MCQNIPEHARLYLNLDIVRNAQGWGSPHSEACTRILRIESFAEKTEAFKRYPMFCALRRSNFKILH